MTSDHDIVTCLGITHKYGPPVVLDVEHLRLSRGSRTAIVGPDGVGKSTLLGLIAGVKRVQHGSVTVFGEDMAQSGQRAQASPRIAFMPQGLGKNLYPTLSVAENVDFFGRLFGQSRDDRRRRAEQLFAATGLAPFADRPAGKLSGGMKQKLALCCALIHDPDLLILDEPTTGVDPLSRRQFWSLIDGIQARRPELTLVVATAYMDEASRFENLIVMDAGRMLFAGRTKDIVGAAESLEEAYRRLKGLDAVGFVPLPRPPQDGPVAPVIEAQGLTKRFGSFVAVDHVSFQIARGEVFGFLGSNGCGKTTTMKMLTGLLPVDEGTARVLGREVEAAAVESRLHVGYMSQAFTLYEELSVLGNLRLHANLYRIPSVEQGARVADALATFELSNHADELPPSLPLGIRQRLQLAAACLHRPDILILDEPTSGVDPAARDAFWQLLHHLSRRDGVTIFISTHFMNEAERCDRVSLMHAGRVLAVGSPDELKRERGTESLEEAFVGFLLAAEGRGGRSPPEPAGAAHVSAPRPRSGIVVSAGRMWAFAIREAKELARDRIRLSFAIFGPLFLMVVFGFGISFDVDRLPYAVLDRDQSALSREFLDAFGSSRYFQERAPLSDELDASRRLTAGELRLVVLVPPGFGRALLKDEKPQLGFWIDGANPFRGETTRGYAEAALLSAVTQAEHVRSGLHGTAPAISVETRFRYNQDFQSVTAIAPGVLTLLLILIPATMTALGIVREKETGSILNLYASPARPAEFLLGKQAPYVAIGVLSFAALTLVVALVFGVTPKGSLAALSLSAALYVFAATGLGLVVSAFTRTQVAAVFGTAILTTVPAINFSGFLYPAAALEGPPRLIGLSFPSLWFQTTSLGVFDKDLTFGDLGLQYAALAAFGGAYLILAWLLVEKQER
ncbi:MAG: ribosome-associated ATPase/putative transporter RbbA [Alsobacter sp.]